MCDNAQTFVCKCSLVIVYSQIFIFMVIAVIPYCYNINMFEYSSYLHRNLTIQSARYRTLNYTGTKSCNCTILFIPIVLAVLLFSFRCSYLFCLMFLHSGMDTHLYFHSLFYFLENVFLNLYICTTLYLM